MADEIRGDAIPRTGAQALADIDSFDDFAALLEDKTLMGSEGTRQATFNRLENYTARMSRGVRLAIEGAERAEFREFGGLNGFVAKAEDLVSLLAKGGVGYLSDTTSRLAGVVFHIKEEAFLLFMNPTWRAGALGAVALIAGGLGYLAWNRSAAA